KPVAGGVEFYVDGVLQTTVALALPASTPLHVAMSDFVGDATAQLKADSVQVLDFPASGTFTSAVFDAGAVATWLKASWNAVLPANTTLVVQTRSGSTATPDGTWSAWAAATNGGSVGSPNARYLQYRVILTTTDPTVTARLLDITFLFSGPLVYTGVNPDLQQPMGCKSGPSRPRPAGPPSFL